MARLNAEQMMAQAVDNLGAEPDDSGLADLVFDKGSLVLAADGASVKPGFERLKKVDGYRWLMINQQDLLAANTLSLGSKAGIISAEGKVLKAANLPRKAM